MFLFKILFSLLFLPFTLLGMVLRLFGISTHIFTRLLMMPLKFFARHTVLCLVIIAAVILYLALKKDPHAVDSLKPQPAVTKPKEQPRGVPPLIEPVTKRENGDSAFATDLYAMMTDQERNYYSAVFYKVMGGTPDGRGDDWMNGNTHGIIEPTRTFQNKLGVTCRTFTETLKVHQIEQTLSGTACEKGGGSWCKLKPNATPACNLGYEHGPFEGITKAIKNLF